MGERFRFSLRNAMLAMTQLAVCCAIIAARNSMFLAVDRRHWFLIGALQFGLVVALALAAVGTLFDRPRLGIACGLASAAAMLAIIVTI